ncbi:MAG: hypothetical protein WAN65_13845 [Candidatus Sulfotelmatobacter sp.]
MIYSFEDLEFLVKTASPEFIAEKYGVNAHVVSTLLHDIDGLRAYLEQHVPVDSDTPTVAPVPALEFIQPRQEWGYTVHPRHRYIFIRPCPATHPARSVFPKSEPTDQEIGFVHASVVDDLNPGDLVSYDRFSAISGGMDLVDDSGEPIYCVMIDEVAVTAVLERKETK